MVLVFLVLLVSSGVLVTLPDHSSKMPTKIVAVLVFFSGVVRPDGTSSELIVTPSAVPTVADTSRAKFFGVPLLSFTSVAPGTKPPDLHP